MSSIAEWLKNAGLEKHTALFEEQEITLEVLPHLTEADVDGLGLPIGARRRLVVEIKRLAEETARPRSRPSSTRREDDSLAPARSPGSGRREHEALGPERRQLTVMFCDLVGSTALAERVDPEELRELMQAYRAACGDVVARYDGHVAQYLGDGLMVYFGWPVAHEDAAERAVRSALEMVQAVRVLGFAQPLTVRIGLATGPVVVGEAGQDSTEARLAIGETPNLAARIQGLASPQEVVIAPATRRLLGDSFALSDLGEQQLKGVAQPVHVWRVDAVKRKEGRFEAAHAGMELPPLVGRAEETSEMLRLWRSACKGEGRAVVIGGEPGIGKSRLMQGLREQIVERRDELHYQCSPYHLNSALYPIIEHLEVAAGFRREDTAEQKLLKLEEVLKASRLKISEVGPFFAALHSLPVDRYPTLNLSPQKRKERTLEAIASLVEARAAQNPVLFVVEDTHWIDPTSEELIELLLSRIDRMRVLLVTTHRLERVPPWAFREGVESLSLTRLDRQHGARIVSSVTHGRALPPEVLEEILSRTDGVPLFVEELTKSLLESGMLREEGERYTLQAPIDSMAIPSSLRDSLMSRLDRLAGCKEIAQIGACIGREFSFRLISRVAPISGEALEEALERLVEAGLVTRRDEPPAAIYTFKHALVQDAAYDSLLKSRRRELHTRIAQALEDEMTAHVAEPEWLAHHHTQAGNLTEAVPLWRRAGVLAVERVALREAVGHFQKGLALIEQLPKAQERDRLELTIREPLNAAWTGLRGWAAAEVGQNAQAILLLTTEENMQSRILAMWWMWTTTITQGRIADSLEWAERMLALGQQSADPDLQLFGHAAMMVQHLLQGELMASREAAERVLAQYDPERAERWIQLTGQNLRTFAEVYSCQLTWMLGYPDQALRASEASTAHARTVGHSFNLVWALTFSSYVFAYRGDSEGLSGRLDEADRLAKEQGIAFISQVSVPQARGIAELLARRTSDAVALLRPGIDAWTSRGGHVRVPYLKAALAEAVAREGEPLAALVLIEECLEQISRPGWHEREWLAEVLRVKGWILMRCNRVREAETELRASLDWAQTQRAKSWELRTATTLATLLSEAGRREEAHALLAPVFAWFTEGFETKDLVEAKALLAELAG